MSNRLAGESSPYLLQHAENPVDWHPWGDEAFATAAREGKPIFLSIGYSTCHWCHVMERESFVDEAVAALLNERFISVKVDREERPDVDQVYMRVCQALNGSGGWPLTIVMTPDAEPFFAATYLPKETRAGRPGLIEILTQLSDFWQKDQSKVIEAAAKLTHAMRVSAAEYPGGSAKRFDNTLYSLAAAELSQRHDAKWGGFGEAPKFPAPHNISFLLRRHRRSGSAHMLGMATGALDAMRAGGLWDHVGFGFHRYSTDRRWLVPHFEKMLYDQAGLAIAFAEAFQVSRRPEYAKVAVETLGYVDTTLSDREGGFWCGEDADSEGVEGKFYLWSKEELLKILGSVEGERFCNAYGVTEEGNFSEEATGAATGLNVLHSPKIGDWHTTAERFADALTALRSARGMRVPPSKDTKVLTGWSAFCASAFIKTGAALGREEFTARGAMCLRYLFSALWSEGKLKRARRTGARTVEGFAEDYAYLARASLDLHRSTLDGQWLEQAEAVAEALWTRFSSEEGGLYDNAAGSEKLLFRPREATDGASPSGASVAVETFARLGLATGDDKWTGRARSLMAAEAGLVARFPSVFTHFLQGAMLVTEPSRTLRIYGSADSPARASLLASANRVFSPENETAEGKGPVSKAKATLCDRRACLYDLIDPKDLEEVLVNPTAQLTKEQQ